MENSCNMHNRDVVFILTFVGRTDIIDAYEHFGLCTHHDEWDITEGWDTIMESWIVNLHNSKDRLGGLNVD